VLVEPAAALFNALVATGLPVTTGSGGRTLRRPLFTIAPRVDSNLQLRPELWRASFKDLPTHRYVVGLLITPRPERRDSSQYLLEAPMYLRLVDKCDVELGLRLRVCVPEIKRSRALTPL
jgi:hypothetical protein